MASGSQNMTTYNAKRIIGDKTAKDWAGSLLHSGTGGKPGTGDGSDTWIFADDYGTAAAPWGIKHDQTNNDILFIGAGTTNVNIHLGSSKVTATTFDGNANTATIWQTARTLTVGATGKSVNGSADVSWTKAEIIGSGTTAQFLRGDHAWTNTIKQTANSALGIDTNLKIGIGRRDLNFDINNGSGAGINDGYAGGITWGSGTSSYAGIYYQTSGNYGSRLIFGTTDSYANGVYARAIITHIGRVGIGTMTPDSKLHVYSSNSATSTEQTPTVKITGKLDIYDNATGGGTANSLLNIVYNGSHEYGVVMKIHSYGGDSPGIRFSHSSAADDLHKQVNTNFTVGMYYNTTDKFAITRNRGTSGWGTADLVINKDGYIGLGTADPAYKLDVNGSSHFAGTTYINRERHTDASSTEVGNTPMGLLGFKNGYPIYNDPEFAEGTNGVDVYNNSGGSRVAISRISMTSGNSSGYALQITNNGRGNSSPGLGGFYQNISSRANAVFVQIFRAKVPSGYTLNTASNSMGASYTDQWLTDSKGTGKWEWYARIVHCGNSGTFSGGGHVYITGDSGQASVTWYLSYCNCFDITKGNYDGLRTKYSRYVVGDNDAANPGGALLHSGSGRTDASPAGDTWIFYDTLGGTSSPWGIRHDQAANTISFVGGGTQGAYITLNNGNSKFGTISCGAITSSSTIKSTFDGPAFLAQTTAGTWAYLRLHNSSNLWDIATRSNHSAGALELRIGGSDTGYYFNTSDIPEGAANLSSAAAQHSIKFYRNGFLIPYQMDNADDGGMLRVRGTKESNCILELGTWDDSGAGETIQFNYYPTTSQVTPTYSVSVPKHSGTLVTTDGHGASGSWGISVTGSSASCTGNAATATKLGTATVGGSNRPIYLNAGTATAVSWYHNSCSISGGNKANYPWHRFATCTTGAGQWTDKSVIVVLNSRFDGGAYGMVKLSIRTNATNAAKSTSAVWIYRKGFAVDDIKISAPAKTTGTDETINAYIKCSTYPRRIAYILEGSNIGWSLVSSNEPDNTTASDKKGGTEINASVSGNNATDGATVSYANSAGNASGLSSGATLAGPVYFGKSSMDACILGYSSTYPNYGIWYKDASVDTMRFSASNNANTDAGADLCINGNGNGTVTIRGNTILHAGNYTSYTVTKTGSGASGSWGISVTGSSASCTGNAASATKLGTNAGNANTPVYFTGGKPSACNSKLGAQSANGYWGMGSADNAFNVWIRTTTLGIIPYQSGGKGSGHCGIGTSSWYFSTAYIDTITSNKTYGAVWNDIAECRKTIIKEPGRVVIENKSGIMELSSIRMQATGRIISDTYGYCMGEPANDGTPIAIAGRVLVYPYRKIEEYNLGDCVCSAPNGTVDIMTREEIKEYPDRIIGTVSEIPTYEVWSGGAQNGKDDIQVNGRIWIYVR